MANILDMFIKNPPATSKANLKGVDRTPIGADDPSGEFKPSKDLIKNEAALAKARHGNIPTTKYSDSFKTK